jgi:type II restriction/modification system DNA methylase subunit YeeA
MKFITNNPQNATKALIKQRVTRDEIEVFKTNFKALLNQINLIDAQPKDETEEHLKTNIRDFLRDTFYRSENAINTKGRNDLVIHLGTNTNDPVGVIIEAKRPKNFAEMSTPDNPNRKALQELVWYFMNERVHNPALKRLVITNVLDWYIIDVNDFDKLIYNNSRIKKLHADAVKEKKLSSYFYDEVAKILNDIQIDLPCVHFNIRDYEQVVINQDVEDDIQLLSLYKLLSPHYLLKVPIVNDSNTLDKRFYHELLHIIGLAETKEGGKKLIDRLEKGKRNPGTLIESAIAEIDSLDKLSRLDKPSQFGNTNEERLHSVAMELTITWVNRILFLKLLEGQLIKYHKGDKTYAFLNSDRIKSFDDLNTLFFKVLARPYDDRIEDVKAAFAQVPYLNSSLFEPTNLEHSTLFVSNLRDDQPIPVYEKTILTEEHGVKRLDAREKISTLEYLFRFLDAYDFGAEDVGGIRQEKKTIINASVLGLIFEKINGYKDGSFFTPGFITMYMCRETIRKAVVQKFNETYGWNCQAIGDLKEDVYNLIRKPNQDRVEVRKSLNDTFNQIRICDPAVGSGHFLVSALNEMLAVKSELTILTDRNNEQILDYELSVLDDELVVTNEKTGEPFEYRLADKNSQRIQETLFHEKQTIIENCLFGVDINPNSVKICRLRLWIELLKNAYYKGPDYKELETLPNIDINIKCGNSLVSRFAIDKDISEILKSKKESWDISSYKEHVRKYRQSKSKYDKRAAMAFLQMIKKDFKSEVDKPFKKKISEARGLADILGVEIRNLTAINENVDDLKKKHTKAVEALQRLEKERDEIISNKIYENGFEWRFEFPEVLTDDGDFIGFDVVIGNPPYVYRNAEIENLKAYFNESYFNTSGNYDLYKFFIELSIRIGKQDGFSSLITNSSFLLQTSFVRTRRFLLDNSTLKNIIPLGGSVFEEATVDSAIYILQKSKNSKGVISVINPQKPIDIAITPEYSIKQSRFLDNEFLVFDYLLNNEEHAIVNKLILNFPKIETAYEFGVGINTGYTKDELTADRKLDDRYHPMVPGTGVSKYGKIKTEGFIMYDKEFIKSKGKLGRALPDEKFFTEPKILIVRTRNISLKERIIASIDYEKKYNLNRISNIISKGNNLLEGLLGVLNSKLFNWLYSKRYFDYEIKPIYLRNSPLCETNNTELNRLVKEVFLLKYSNEQANIIALTDQIDQLVYQLYELTEEEIQIIEDSFK